MPAKLSASQWSILAVTALVLIVFWSSRMTESPITWDAAENLRLTLNLERSGVISLSTTAPLQPSMYREPLPLFYGQFAVRAVDQALGRADDAEYYRGVRAKLLKYQNIPWLLLLSVAVFLMGRELGLAFTSSWLCVLLTNLLLLQTDTGYFMLDNLYTEAAAAALLCSGSLLLLAGVRRTRSTLIALAGVCFGLLTLVKASYLYIVLGTVIAIPLLAPLLRRSLGASTRYAAVLAAVTLLVTLPWAFRNYVELGYFAIAQRGGEALYQRAVLDQLSWDEYRGAFYHYAPYPLSGALRRLLGYSRRDSDQGGRMQRLNVSSTSSFYVRDYSADIAGRPQDAVTYLHLAGAQRVQLRNQLAAAGNPQPEVESDRQVQARALAIIRQHPLRHLAVILTCLWYEAFFSFPALVFILVYAFRRRNFELAVLVLPAFASLLFYASLAYPEPRYGIPTHPVVICALLVLAFQYRQRFKAGAV